jgi:sortase (surface protein transpeptidase)
MPWTIPASEWKEIVKKMGGAHLTLSTCHPVGSSAQRLLVRAKMTKVQFRSEDGTFQDAVR